MEMDSVPNAVGHPYQTRAMDKTDIRNLRRWHRNAAMPAKQAGFDIVYVYATHSYLLSHFLSPHMNTRTDEYGGSLENRVRLVRELIEETKDTVGDTCAVAVRFSADETIGKVGEPVFGERRKMLEMLGEYPDLWDINIADYSCEMGVSRFVKEATLEPYMNFVKSVTTKPVVTVGRFTSPDTMVGQINRGIVDFIGAARPSIADPFLPNKIKEGRPDDIRECIGCNVCYSSDSLGVPIRCTQNPTMGEEWRKGWHPEKIATRGSDSKVLVVGADPTGFEAVRALGERGYQVMLAEATRDLGGRIAREASLPGLSEWARVRDYRIQQLSLMPNVEISRESKLTADDVFSVEPDHVAIATGATWRTDRFDGQVYTPIIEAGSSAQVFTPDDIMAGRLPSGPTLVFDNDGYYMGSVITERLRAAGVPVTLTMPADSVSSWAGNTDERWRVRTNLMDLGVNIIPAHNLVLFDGSNAVLHCAYTQAQMEFPTASVVVVSQRKPNDTLYHEILDKVDGDTSKLPFTLKRIGDCEAPAIIAAAVYAGHRYAQELDRPVDIDNPIKHDRIDVGQT